MQPACTLRPVGQTSCPSVHEPVGTLSAPPTAPTPAFVVKLLSTGAASQVSTACVPHPTSQTPSRWPGPSWQRDSTQACPGRRMHRELGIGPRRWAPGSQAVGHLLQDVLLSELLPLCRLHYDLDWHEVTTMAAESPDGLTSSPRRHLHKRAASLLVSTGRRVSGEHGNAAVLSAVRTQGKWSGQSLAIEDGRRRNPSFCCCCFLLFVRG